MAKLALFAYTLTAIVAFSEVSAFKTPISTTTIEDSGDGTLAGSLDYPMRGSQKHCRSEIPIQQVNHCQMHLTQGIISNDKPKMVVNRRQRPQPQKHLLQCCAQLKKVSKRCQCHAIQQAYDKARREGGVLEMRQMLSKAQRLPNICRLEVPECPLVFHLDSVI
ncbi:hypothetical protein L1987_02412 [Smallanthus sonchifolius]|uniref:Uncharacterized protein n=1 Tax=Smallanthus sonchifolius TaxID=185202 RepID=A0ACB9K7S3_9ASTR|nr:hypothetical protein L1987_02412 [Smallanthus sonchifolius]